MLYKKGDLVNYKRWQGKIVFVMEENKSYMVELHNYHGLPAVQKQIDQCYLEKAYEQIKIGATK